MTHHPDTCVHQPRGLCPECQRDADEDPEAWTEFGRHPDGIRRARELEEEMRVEAERQRAEDSLPARDDSDIPY